MKFLKLMVALAFSPLLLANTNLPNNPHIVVTGTAELQAEPDIAVIDLAVASLKNKSIDAKKNVDKRVNHLLDGLSRFAINEDNVSASSIVTTPHYSYENGGKEKLAGYNARRHLTITLNNISHLNALMDFALSAKVNQIRNITFKSSKEATLQDKVNALAVQNAKEKATSLASALNAKLGRVYSINTTTNQSLYRYGENRAIESSTLNMRAPARAGKYLQENIVFSAAINVVFDLDLK